MRLPCSGTALVSRSANRARSTSGVTAHLRRRMRSATSCTCAWHKPSDMHHAETWRELSDCRLYMLSPYFCLPEGFRQAIWGMWPYSTPVP